MTIIRPKKENRKIQYLTAGMFFVLIVISAFGFFMYNRLVSVRHEIDDYKITLRDAKVKNAELKNTFYNLISDQQVEALTKNSGLSIDSNPEYVKRGVLVVND